MHYDLKCCVKLEIENEQFVILCVVYFLKCIYRFKSNFSCSSHLNRRLEYVSIFVLHATRGFIRVCKRRGYDKKRFLHIADVARRFFDKKKSLYNAHKMLLFKKFCHPEIFCTKLGKKRYPTERKFLLVKIKILGLEGT